MMMKKIILLTIIALFGTIIAYAQKSVIDLFLENNPTLEKQITCVNITEDKLRMCYENSMLTAPKRYQSISFCNANDIMKKFESNTALKKYTLLKEVKKENGRFVRYFQNTWENKGEKTAEMVVYMYCHDDFSVIYLCGNDLSQQSLNTHLDLIRKCIDKSKCININH